MVMPLNKSLTSILVAFSIGLVSCTKSQENVQQIEIKSAPKKSPQKSGLAILQGYTNEATTQFSILHLKKRRPRFFVRSYESLANFKTKPIDVKRVEMPHSEWAISRIKVSNLRKNKTYRLEVWDKKKFRKLDQREFGTLDLSRSKVKILIAGCFKLNRAYRQADMWREALSHQPDLIILNGDTAYANGRPGFWTGTNPESIWNDYVQWRQGLDLYYQYKLTPTLATWDDGDYGRKDGDRDFKFRNVSKTIFDSFFPQVADGKQLVEGPGIAKLFRGFGLDIFLLDARSFRSPRGESPQTQWGQKQERWLLTRLSQSIRPSFLVQGDQFFGGHHPFDSYEGQRPLSFLNMMERIKKVPKPVAFFSGDRHLTELMALKAPEWPYPSFEFTTSALHANTYKGTLDKYPNPRQIYGVDGIKNYGTLDVTTNVSSAQVRIRAWGPLSKKLYDQNYILKR